MNWNLSQRIDNLRNGLKKVIKNLLSEDDKINDYQASSSPLQDAVKDGAKKTAELLKTLYDKCYSIDVDILNIKSDQSELRFHLRNKPGDIIFNHQTKEVIIGEKKFCDYGKIDRWEDNTDIHHGDERLRAYPKFTLKDINGNYILLLAGDSILSWYDPSSDDREWDQFQENIKILKKVCLSQGWSF